MKVFSLTCLLCINVIVYAQNGYNVYFGNLHSHTGYSDGQQTPVDAFVYARDEASLDFLAVTDHMEQISSDEWTQTRAAADAITVNGVFVGIAGYEWGSPYYGHCNVFNEVEMPSVLTYTNWSGFRDWLDDHPVAFAQFNHPGDEDYFNNWYDFEYKGPATDYAFPLIEFQNIQQADDWYELALNNGWHLSPVWNQDNHQADWGNKNNGRAAIWSTSLSRAALFEAIRAGRTFATMDKNASVWIESDFNEMGSETHRYGNMPFRIMLNDIDSEVWSTIELRSNNGVLASFSATGTIDTVLLMTLYTDKYVYVRAIQEDGDYVWSAPIYLTGTITGYQPALLKASGVIDFNIMNQTISVHSSIELPDAQICIVDAAGKIVFRQVCLLQAGQNWSFQLESLPQGMYIIAISTRDFMWHNRFAVLF